MKRGERELSFSGDGLHVSTLSALPLVVSRMIHRSGLDIPLVHIRAEHDGTYYGGSFPRGTLVDLTMSLDPAAPRQQCNLSQTHVDPEAEDVSVKVVLPRSVSGCPTYTPSTSVSLPRSGGVVTNVIGYSRHLFYLENGLAADEQGTVLLFDQAGVIDEAPFKGRASSLFTEDGSSLSFLRYDACMGR